MKDEQEKEQAIIDAKTAQKAFEVEMEEMKDKERTAIDAAQKLSEEKET